jgi:protein-tyrosine-phosphatase
MVMKILYVCKANVGRSQMAEAFHRSFYPEDTISSAGTQVNVMEGQRIGDYDKANLVWEIMDEEGIDVRGYVRNQLNEKIVKEADRVVIMVDKKEWPDYLLNNPNVEYWDIKDPAWTGLEFHTKTRDLIKQRVKDFSR